MADDVSLLSLSSEKANVGADGQITNQRDRGNMFEDAVVLTEKQKMRKKMEEDKVAMKEMLKQMSPIDIFVLFDDDESGFIDFDEFRRLLPMLDIEIPDAKAFRYFKICDSDGSGEIDLDEFKVALFTCDPTSGNPVGFKPSKYLTPNDAFEMFDEDLSGFLDEDEMYYAFEYLKLKLKDTLHEKVFDEIDYNNTGSIDYFEFREIFFMVCDVKAELEQRDITVPSFTSRETLVKMLRPLVIEEEEKEMRAIAEAKRYKTWLQSVREKRKYLTKAEWRACYELKQAMDCGGHVYCFGGGSNGQFFEEPPRKIGNDDFQFEKYEKLVELWKDRVKPEQLEARLAVDRRALFQEEARDDERTEMGGAIGGVTNINRAKKLRDCFIDPYQEAKASKFKGLNVGVNTVGLWGKRIHHITLSESVAFALTENGDVFCWGGNNYWWHEIQADSIFQTKWRGDTTPRSQLLLNTTGKSLPMDNGADDIEEKEVIDEDAKKVEIIKATTKYYNLWEPPRNAANRMHFLERELLPRVNYDDIRFSLEFRGKVIKEATKLELCEELAGDIDLEKRLLGERAHKAIRESETQVINLNKRKNFKLAKKIMDEVDRMWKPLREVQAEERAAKKAKAIADAHNAATKLENSYQNWRKNVFDGREDVRPQVTPRGNSLKIDLSGLTPRGPEVKMPKGYQSSIQVAAGQSHVCLVHKSGQLYSWGTGISGRLGLDLTEGGDAQKDTSVPRVVQALLGKPVVRVSCGYSHTGAIVAGGELYMWGSAATGKCGLGPVTKKIECYCSVPTKVIVGNNRCIRKISCGAAHTAVVTDNGQLYVFGCGDGGRLGLGKREYKYDTVFTPQLVESLEHEHISSVTCGNSTTFAVTEVKHVWRGEKNARYRGLGGGLVYMAGSLNVLGRQCDNFELLEEMKEYPIKQVSAGYMHTALLTAEGELWCFGRNRNVCCGSNPMLHFLDKPQRVECLYQEPLNLAPHGKACTQSSCYGGRTGDKAIDNEISGFGMKKCASTQQDAQAWWEIDLGANCNIEQIKIWNRTDSPHDSASPADFYTRRLFPCWVMVSVDPFERSVGPISLKNSLKQAKAKTKFTENVRCSTWTLPMNIQARYVRVQLEGFNFLTLAQVEIFGQEGYSRGVGKVGFAVAGTDCTMALTRPSRDPKDIETAYKRAAYADSTNADILRQLETFALEYDKFGRGDVLWKACAICSGLDKCEICHVRDNYLEELENMQPGIGGRRRRLKSIEEYLLNHSKPPLVLERRNKKERPSKWDERRATYSRITDKLRKWWSDATAPKKVRELRKQKLELQEDPSEIIAAFKNRKSKELGAEEEKKVVFEEPKLTESSSTKRNNYEKSIDTTGRKAKGPIPKAMASKIEKTDSVLAEQKMWKDEEIARKKASEQSQLAR